jgi:transcriptional regulator with XRE-family HTH domain
MFNREELRMLRLSRGLKQAEVARKMRISKQRFSQLENHKSLSEIRIQQILNALGYTVDSANKYIKSIPPPPMKVYQTQNFKFRNRKNFLEDEHYNLWMLNLVITCLLQDPFQFLPLQFYML